MLHSLHKVIKAIKVSQWWLLSTTQWFVIMLKPKNDFICYGWIIRNRVLALQISRWNKMLQWFWKIAIIWLVIHENSIRICILKFSIHINFKLKGTNSVGIMYWGCKQCGKQSASLK